MDQRDDRTFEEFYSSGTDLLHRGKAQDAAELLEMSRQLRPDHLDAAINLGGAYILSGRFKDAVRVLEDAVQIEPGSAMAWTNLGAAYLGNPVLARDKEQLKAIAAFRKVLEIQPGASSVAYNIGLIYRDRNEWNEAANWFGEAVKSNPNDKDARTLLSKMNAIRRENEFSSDIA